MRYDSQIESPMPPAFRKRWHPVLGVSITRQRFRRRALQSGRLAAKIVAPALFRRFSRFDLKARQNRPFPLHASRKHSTRKKLKADQSLLLMLLQLRPQIARIHREPKQTHDLYRDMRESRAVLDYARSSIESARRLYGALCNVSWQKDGEVWAVTWRAAGAAVARLRNRGEWYMDFYCSGGEGTVDPEVGELLARLGWQPMDDDE